ncbi:MAG: hypothetical protein ACI9HK_001135 [Pirellulaceae bacterium]|jgi:uncharacterized protein (DUF1697 family)
MTTWITLFRGINVGGKNKLPMKVLVEQLDELGLENVQTYIQSGNVVFDSASKTASKSFISKLSAEISASIEQRCGFRPAVMLITRKAFEEIVSLNPFPEGESEPKSLHVFFLAEQAKSPDMDSLASAKSPTESCHLEGNAFYLHAPEGIGRSKLAANAEKYLGVSATARNWRTVQKLLEMVC